MIKHIVYRNTGLSFKNRWDNPTYRNNLYINPVSYYLYNNINKTIKKPKISNIKAKKEKLYKERLILLYKINVASTNSVGNPPLLYINNYKNILNLYPFLTKYYKKYRYIPYSTCKVYKQKKIKKMFIDISISNRLSCYINNYKSCKLINMVKNSSLILNLVKNDIFAYAFYNLTSFKMYDINGELLNEQLLYDEELSYSLIQSIRMDYGTEIKNLPFTNNLISSYRTYLIDILEQLGIYIYDPTRKKFI